jgi:putative hydrolase of the HAD superfamily
MQPIRFILFDLGGVLIRLRGHRVLLDYMPKGATAASFLNHWLQSPAVRQFESGRMSLPDFCRAVIPDMGLQMSEAAFLEVFERFLEAPYEGPAQMLPLLARRFTTGILSNTSEPHWARACAMLPELAALPHAFLSCRLGMLKPDAAIFEAVMDQLGASPAEVLYFDDHPVNVTAARALGIQAVRVDGFGEALEAMVALGVLSAEECLPSPCLTPRGTRK